MAKEFNIDAILNKTVVLPPLPPFPAPDKQAISGIAEGEFTGLQRKEPGISDVVSASIFMLPQVLPVMIKLPTESKWFLFPTEPLISVEGKNSITKRNVAKKRSSKGSGSGSVKEYWTQDDYTINFSGLLTNPETTEFPWEDLNRLQHYCTAGERLEIKNRLLLELGITHIVIESYTLPFTKGNENQKFTISAVSDKDFDLFIPLEGNLN